jgi:NDP-sugar pyrophosphorylase family protein
MKAVIIAGGLGTRLRPLTYNTPKPIVPVANRPFAVHQIELLVRHGIKEIIFSIHYLSGEIRKTLEDGKRWGIKIHYCLEDKPLGTAGAVKNAQKYFDGSPLIVFNGDILTDANISKIINFHNEKKATVTLTLTEVEDPTAFGLILTEKDGRVRRFLEKPSWDMVVAKTINAGIYVVDPNIFEKVPAGEEYSFERQLFPNLLEEGAPIYGYLSNAYWVDIGSPEKYKEAHQAILRGEVAAKIFGSRIEGKFWLGKETDLGVDVKFGGPSVIGEKVRIGSGTEIRDYVVAGDRVSIGEGCFLDRTIIWKETRIGNRVILNDCVVGSNCVLEDDVEIGRGAVIADGCVIKKGTRLPG